jgi:FlaA1/EpsC-like NDP-sugar epimerase
MLGISRLLLLDHAENSVFEIERELKQCNPEPEVVPIVGDIRDRFLLDHLFARYRPHVVLHSATYKHVPMMESNPSEAFLNNVIGTRTLLGTALEYGSERFVMISSDKAVSPSSVMGATKRLGEMLMQQKAAWARDARLASVRFGNVVGSRGSVIPIFLKQIAEGKPLTLTDERMSRYFMTVKEAVQLVLQASTLATEGEIYTLDMGDPIMISKVAKKLIEMSGLRPEKDVPINIIGIRPGEKLQEELWSDDSEVSATEFPRVLRVDTPDNPADLDIYISELEELAVARRNDELREKLRNLPSGRKEQDKLVASAGD